LWGKIKPNVLCSGRDLEENCKTLLCSHVSIQKQAGKNRAKGRLREK
jgi:hypothetical protein